MTFVVRLGRRETPSLIPRVLALAEPWDPVQHAADRHQAAMTAVVLKALTLVPTSRSALVAAVADRDMGTIAEVLGLHTLQNRFADLIRPVFRQTLIAGANAAPIPAPPPATMVAADPAPTMNLRFDVTNPQALTWLQNYTIKLAADASGSTSQAVNDVLQEGFAKQIDVRDLATTIEGIAGLTPTQAGWVTSMQSNLIAQGLTSADATRQATKYGDRLRKQRAETIARTEVIRASNMGQQMLWQQGMSQGLLDERRVQRRWIITPDDRLCPNCRLMTGDRALTAFTTPFDTPLGPYMVPPMHPRCRCAVSLVVAPVEKYDPMTAEPTAPSPHEVVDREAELADADTWSAKDAFAGNVNMLGEAQTIFDLVARMPNPMAAIETNYATTPGVYGSYYQPHYTNDYTPRIEISNEGRLMPAELATTLHEMGHALDFGLTDLDGFLTGTQAGNAFWSAYTETDQFTQLSAKLKQYRTAAATTTDPVLAQQQGDYADYLQYLMRPEEVWARAFTQYSMETAATVDLGKAQNRNVTKALKEMYAGDVGQWQPTDFAPVRDSMKKILKTRKAAAPSAKRTKKP